ncbi:Serine/threonine-protein kinase fray2 [Linum perenne]
MEHVPEKRYPVSAEDYKLYEEVGEGVSATVHRALCIPLDEIVAIKVLDLEKCNNDLDGIRREVHTMTLIDHPNVLRAHCSFTAGHNLWVVMPYMAGGSCLHIMKSAYPEGLEEPVIATLLREILKALVYLHSHGFIHRDVKAGNILIDSNGAVKLADFGVSACMFDTGDRQRSRNTFVGTPCWMAPEVMQQLHGYEFRADVWSFGITALELAHGHAPFSKYPPMKVLLMTLQNAPPGLDYERDKRFSKSFKELVAACLVKDPKKRPTSEKLLNHHFFKHARSADYVARSILGGLSSLGDRFRILKEKEADLLLQNKPLSDDKEQLSQQEYIRGISAWNFNLEDLKNQASLIQDDGYSMEEQGICGNQKGSQADEFLDVKMSTQAADNTTPAINEEDGINDLPNLESSLAAFPVKPLQALKGCFDVGENDGGLTIPNVNCANEVQPEELEFMRPIITEHEIKRSGDQNIERTNSLPRHVNNKKNLFFSGPTIADNSTSQAKIFSEENRTILGILSDVYSSPLQYSLDGKRLCGLRQDANQIETIVWSDRREIPIMSYLDTADGAIVQRKGRFKVTSADLSPKSPTNCYLNSVSQGSASPTSSNITAASILPSLQCILHQNTMQRQEEIIKLIKYMEQSSAKQVVSVDATSYEHLQVSGRERELQGQLFSVQKRIASMYDELQKQKMRNVQIERQLS